MWHWVIGALGHGALGHWWCIHLPVIGEGGDGLGEAQGQLLEILEIAAVGVGLGGAEGVDRADEILLRDDAVAVGVERREGGEQRLLGQGLGLGIGVGLGSGVGG